MAYTMTKHTLHYVTASYTNERYYQGGNGLAGLYKDMILETCPFAQLISDNDPEPDINGVSTVARNIVIRINNERNIKISAFGHSSYRPYGMIVLYIQQISNPNSVVPSSTLYIYNDGPTAHYAIRNANCYILMSNTPSFDSPFIAIMRLEDGEFLMLGSSTTGFYRLKTDDKLNVIPINNGYNFYYNQNKVILTPAIVTTNAFDYTKKLFGETGFIVPNNFLNLSTTKFYKDAEGNTYAYMNGKILYNLDY